MSEADNTDHVEIAFSDTDDATKPILGVATVAHLVAAAAREGVSHVAIILPDGRLPGNAADDVTRAAGPARVVYRNSYRNSSQIRTARAFTPESLTRKRLLQATSKPSDGFVSRWINRPVSQAISGFLLRIPGVRPWHATAAVGIVAALMFLSLLRGDYAGLIAGALLFQTASVLDGVDGEIARATYRSSEWGAMLDTTVDMATNAGFFIGVTVCLTALYGRAQALAGCGAVALLIAGLLTMRMMAVRQGDPSNFNFLKRFYRERFPTGVASAITESLVFVTSRDFFALATAVAIVLGLGWVVPFGLLFFAAIWLGFILLAVRPILRKGSSSAMATPMTVNDGISSV